MGRGGGGVRFDLEKERIIRSNSLCTFWIQVGNNNYTNDNNGNNDILFK